MATTAEQLAPRVDKLEKDVSDLEKDVADLQSSQREDAHARGLVAALDASTTALANGFQETGGRLARLESALAIIKADLHTLRRQPAVNQAPGMALLANIIAQAVSGQDAASAEALAPTLVVLISFLFGPRVLGRYAPGLVRFFPALGPAAAVTPASEAMKTTNGVADKEIH